MAEDPVESECENCGGTGRTGPNNDEWCKSSECGVCRRCGVNFGTPQARINHYIAAAMKDEECKEIPVESECENCGGTGRTGPNNDESCKSPKCTVCFRCGVNFGTPQARINHYIAAAMQDEECKGLVFND